ncbi:unnamed protein product [Adineta ricciae]|uniref:Uncharacterized protein n=1 Tax=Adineta ricciae TaxID=249248 RepID=A0A815M876_ADIRI|nr:unnamed protein product [Adineta ricciae]CAF1671799.1 unnamed protein product [Adineta ricciae]
MAGSKDQIICDVQAIVNIVAGTASLEQEYQTTVFTSCTCPSCCRTYWRLVRSKHDYLSLYPYCPNCGWKIELDDIIEDYDIIGAEVLFIQKDNKAYASFKLTHKALETQNIKQMIQKCNARYIW